MKAIFKRELQAYFYAPAAYVFMGVFLALGSVFFAVGNLASRSGDLPSFLWNMSYLWMLLTPILTMHTYAGERKARTDQLLYTSPVSMAGVAVGKYLAGCAVLGLTVLLSAVYALIVALYGKLYVGEALCCYLGFILQGCAFLALDMLVSARARTPVTAALWAFGVNLLLWLLDVLSSAVSVAAVSRALSFVSLYKRYAPFQQGQLSYASALYFAAFIALMLFFTVRTLDARRWRQS
ncbi:MAG: ABC transporter permease subunit [Clostridia bacterium]|nr:ABC transporter permease subunit [Clostridia bacterium]